MKGIYIVLEGIVGTGKSTQSKKLHEYLKKEFPNREIILTREPGGDEIAEAIRKIVQGTDFNEKMMPECEAYLYASARSQSLRTIVKPALERGAIVISDRSFFSSIAYQGFARPLGIDKVIEINKPAIDSILPDLVLYIDLEPEIGLKRTFDKKGDKFEREDIAFFKKIEQGYKELSSRKELFGKWINIEGKGNIEEVFSRISKQVKDFLLSF